MAQSPPAQSRAALSTSHDPTTKALHWLAALLVVGTWSLGMSMDLFPRGPDRAGAFSIHATLGLLVLTLSVARILWRFSTRHPEAEGPWWMASLARLGHWGLYALTVALPLTGLLARWSRGTINLVFGVSMPAPFPVPRLHLWMEMHEAMGTLIPILVGVHVLAALFHHVVLRDGVLRRMVPAWR